MNNERLYDSSGDYKDQVDLFDLPLETIVAAVLNPLNRQNIQVAELWHTAARQYPDFTELDPALALWATIRELRLVYNHTTAELLPVLQKYYTHDNEFVVKVAMIESLPLRALQQFLLISQTDMASHELCLHRMSMPQYQMLHRTVTELSAGHVPSIFRANWASRWQVWTYQITHEWVTNEKFDDFRKQTRYLQHHALAGEFYGVIPGFGKSLHPIGDDGEHPYVVQFATDAVDSNDNLIKVVPPVGTYARWYRWAHGGSETVKSYICINCWWTLGCRAVYFLAPLLYILMLTLHFMAEIAATDAMKIARIVLYVLTLPWLINLCSAIASMLAHHVKVLRNTKRVTALRTRMYTWFEPYKKATVKVILSLLVVAATITITLLLRYLFTESIDIPAPWYEATATTILIVGFLCILNDVTYAQKLRSRLMWASVITLFGSWTWIYWGPAFMIEPMGIIAIGQAAYGIHATNKAWKLHDAGNRQAVYAMRGWLSVGYILTAALYIWVIFRFAEKYNSLESGPWEFVLGCIVFLYFALATAPLGSLIGLWKHYHNRTGEEWQRGMHNVIATGLGLSTQSIWKEPRLQGLHKTWYYRKRVHLAGGHTSMAMVVSNLLAAVTALGTIRINDRVIILLQRILIQVRQCSATELNRLYSPELWTLLQCTQPERADNILSFSDEEVWIMIGNLMTGSTPQQAYDAMMTAYSQRYEWEKKRKEQESLREQQPAESIAKQPVPVKRIQLYKVIWKGFVTYTGLLWLWKALGLFKKLWILFKRYCPQRAEAKQLQ